MTGPLRLLLIVAVQMALGGFAPARAAEVVADRALVDLGAVPLGRALTFSWTLEASSAATLASVEVTAQSAQGELSVVGDLPAPIEGTAALSLRMVARQSGRFEARLRARTDADCGRGDEIELAVRAQVMPECWVVHPPVLDVGGDVDGVVYLEGCADTDLLLDGAVVPADWRLDVTLPVEVPAGATVTLPIAYRGGGGPSAGQLILLQGEQRLGAVEVIANDCESGDPRVHDDDRDGVSNCGVVVDDDPDWADEDGDGVARADGDCDDTVSQVHPFAQEWPNGRDDNCNGQIDEGHVDVDGDGMTLVEGDCHDGQYWMHPDIDEQCHDRIDNDCDGVIDEDCEAEEPTCGRARSTCGCSLAPSGVPWGALALLGLTIGGTRRVR